MKELVKYYDMNSLKWLSFGLHNQQKH